MKPTFTEPAPAVEDLDDLEHTCDGAPDTPNDCARCQMDEAVLEATLRRLKLVRPRPRREVAP